MLQSITSSLTKLAISRTPALGTLTRGFSKFGLDDGSFMHHRHSSGFRDYEKFRSPRRRASKLFNEIKTEAVAQSKERNPSVLNVPFRIGDSIEIEKVIDGGINSTLTEKVRGVVIARYNKGMETSVLIRDIISGQSIERQIFLHSPLIRSLKVLEQNFVFKGRRKVKRSKLYYLRQKNPARKLSAPCCAVLCYAVLCYAVLRCDMLLLYYYCCY
jgi:large subunit ribosomal protein L19